MTRSQEADSTCLTRSAKDPQGHSGENGNGAKLVGENVKISDAADFNSFLKYVLVFNNENSHEQA